MVTIFITMNENELQGPFNQGLIRGPVVQSSPGVRLVPGFFCFYVVKPLMLILALLLTLCIYGKDSEVQGFHSHWG